MSGPVGADPVLLDAWICGSHGARRTMLGTTPLKETDYPLLSYYQLPLLVVRALFSPPLSTLEF